MSLGQVASICRHMHEMLKSALQYACIVHRPKQCKLDARECFIGLSGLQTQDCVGMRQFRLHRRHKRLTLVCLAFSRISSWYALGLIGAPFIALQWSEDR